MSVLVGTQSNGQGHETAYAQVLNDRLGMPFEKIRIVQGDTSRLKMGRRHRRLALADRRGHGDPRRLRHGDRARQALRRPGARDRGRRHRVRAASGEFRVIGTDRRIGLLELAAKARTMAPPEGAEPPGWTPRRWPRSTPGPSPTAATSPRSRSTPTPGSPRIVRYTAVDDFGVVLNPMLVAGQVHGGVVQGIGQALYEHAVYDDSGQLLVRLVHGLLHAAGRRRAGDRRLDHRGAVHEQPAWASRAAARRARSPRPRR